MSAPSSPPGHTSDSGTLVANTCLTCKPTLRNKSSAVVRVKKCRWVRSRMPRSILGKRPVSSINRTARWATFGTDTITRASSVAARRSWRRTPAGSDRVLEDIGADDDAVGALWQVCRFDAALEQAAIERPRRHGACGVRLDGVDHEVGALQQLSQEPAGGADIENGSTLLPPDERRDLLVASRGMVMQPVTGIHSPAVQGKLERRHHAVTCVLDAIHPANLVAIVGGDGHLHDSQAALPKLEDDLRVEVPVARQPIQRDRTERAQRIGAVPE